MSKIYDATNEFKKFEVSETSSGHPRPRTGATAKKRTRMESRRAAEVATPAVKGKKK